MNKSDLIVNYLANSTSDYVTSTQLGDFLNSSTRTVLRYIRDVQSESHEHGFEIVSSKGQGYRLVVKDKDAFQNYLTDNMADHKKSEQDKLEYQVARQILVSDCVKLDDLAVQFNYSRSSMSRVTSGVASILEGYNLELESKAHQGLSVQGSEINIRHCISNLFFHDFTMSQSARMLQVEDTDWNAVKKAAAGMAASRNYSFTQDSLIKFIKYCFISLNRIRNGHYIDFEHILNLQFDIVTQETLTLIPEFLKQILPDYKKLSAARRELFYLALAWEQSFCPAKRPYDPDPKRKEYFLGIVKKAVFNIKNYYDVDFTTDDQFVRELADHLSECYGKYLLAIEGDNTRLDEVRSRYPNAYYYSVEVAACINEDTKIKVPDDELSLITLHFAAKIESEHNKPIKAVLFSDHEFGIAELLKSRIQKQYGNIHFIESCPLNELKTCPLNADLYITDMPAEEKNLNGKSILYLSPYLDEQDCRMLDSAIARLSSNDVSMQSICEPNHFYVLNKPAKKTHLLNYLCDGLLQEGRITEKEKADIFAREALVSTEIAPGVAMPHCVIHGSSFLVFAVLPKSVIWDENKISLIVLGCFHEGDDQIKHLLKQLYKVLSNKQQVDKIVECKSYEEFIKLMNDFMGEELC